MDYLLLSNVASFVFCFVLLIFISIMLSNKNNSVRRYVLRAFVVIVMIYLLADMTSYLVDTQTFPGANVINHISMVVRVFMTVFAGAWLNYTSDVLFHVPTGRRKALFAYGLPLVGVLIVLVLNIFFGFLFTIDENNVYARGQLYLLSVSMQYAYFVVAFVRALLVKRRAYTKKRSKLRHSLLSMSAIAMAFGILQMLGGGKVAFLCFGITIGAVNMFLYFQEDQITQDGLTGLNNRYALDTYLLQKLGEHDHGDDKRLYLVMMDMDGFKEVNDLYGHVDGDRALVNVAANLKKIAAQYKNMFIARFGGDEFTAVFETRDEEAVKTFCQRITDAVSKEFINQRYKLSISTGYARYERADMTMEALYQAADRVLYANKRQKRAENLVEYTIPNDVFL